MQRQTTIPALQKQQIKDLISQMRASGNPQTFLQNYLMQNPYLNNAMELVRSVGNPRQAALLLAQQRGINVQELIDLFN